MMEVKKLNVHVSKSITVELIKLLPYFEHCNKSIRNI